MGLPAGSRRHFFDQRGVLLGDLVHLRNRLAHLDDPFGLLAAGVADGADDGVHLANCAHHFLHRLARLLGQGIARAHALHAVLTSSPTLAFGHRLRGKEGDSYGATHEKPRA